MTQHRYERSLKDVRFKHPWNSPVFFNSQPEVNRAWNFMAGLVIGVILFAIFVM